MIKCETIKQFTLKRFDELKNIKRVDKEEAGRLFVGDVFECSEELADYLMGNNANNEVVVKVVEVASEESEVKVVKKKSKNKKKTKKGE